MWGLSLPWWEFVLRAISVYVFLLVMLRLTGVRQIGQMSPFDFVLLLVLSNSVQNSMNGGDNSVSGGLILASTLMLVNWIIGRMTLHSRSLERIVEGQPVVLVHNGSVDHSALQKLDMTLTELEAALRSAGCMDASEVRFAILEINGRVSVIPHKPERDDVQK